MTFIDHIDSRSFPEHVCAPGHVSRMWVYPVKSCAGIEVEQAELLATGLAWDRCWMIVDAAGHFLSQRQLPRMALLQPRLEAQALVLQMGPAGQCLLLPLLEGGAARLVRVWKDSLPAWDMGDEVATGLSAFLGQPCRLVRFDSRQRRLSSLQWTGGLEAPNQFADGYPLLVLTQGAIDELNSRLLAKGHAAVALQRFRPNLVIDGFAPHAEDRLTALHVAGAQVQLELVKPCNRCPVPDIDPLTALHTLEVGQTLREYRRDVRLNGAVTFGMNAIVSEGVGRLLRVGQRVAGLPALA